MTYIQKNIDNIIAVGVTIVILIVAWFAFDAFFGLVGSLYDFLDIHIWAFFAGILSFIFALALVVLMIKISFWVIVLFIGITLSILVTIFDRR